MVEKTDSTHKKKGGGVSIDRKELYAAACVYAVVHQQPVRVYVDNVAKPATEYAFMGIYSRENTPKGFRFYYDVRLEEAERELCQQPIKS